MQRSTPPASSTASSGPEILLRRHSDQAAAVAGNSVNRLNDNYLCRWLGLSALRGRKNSDGQDHHTGRVTSTGRSPRVPSRLECASRYAFERRRARANKVAPVPGGSIVEGFGTAAGWRSL